MGVVKRVLLPEPVEREALELLKEAGCEVVESPDRNPETVKPLMRGIHGVVLRTGIKMTEELIGAGDDLCIISRTGGGYDNVDVAAATARGVVVTSNVGVNTISVVEHAFALMLALSKQLFVMDRAVRSGDFMIRRKNLPRDLHGKVLGLMGFGRIGIELGRACRQVFDMRILATTGSSERSKRLREENRDWVEYVDLEALFRRSDVISVNVPLRPDTRHAVGAEQLSWMKPDGILINTSRGGVVDEDALCKALEERRIGGAGLDVFSQEPPSVDHPLFRLDNVVVTPHSAALTQECTVRMATEAVRCVVDLLGGREPVNVANPEVLGMGRWSHLERRV